MPEEKYEWMNKEILWKTSSSTDRQTDQVIGKFQFHLLDGGLVEIEWRKQIDELMPIFLGKDPSQ